MKQRELPFLIDDEEIAADGIETLQAMEDRHRCAVALYMRDHCIIAMMQEDDAVTAAKWRQKGEAWDAVRQAYELRRDGCTDLDLLIVEG